MELWKFIITYLLFGETFQMVNVNLGEIKDNLMLFFMTEFYISEENKTKIEELAELPALKYNFYEISKNAKAKYETFFSYIKNNYEKLDEKGKQEFVDLSKSFLFTFIREKFFNQTRYSSYFKNSNCTAMLSFFMNDEFKDYSKEIIMKNIESTYITYVAILDLAIPNGATTNNSELKIDEPKFIFRPSSTDNISRMDKFEDEIFRTYSEMVLRIKDVNILEPILRGVKRLKESPITNNPNYPKFEYSFTKSYFTHCMNKFRSNIVIGLGGFSNRRDILDTGALSDFFWVYNNLFTLWDAMYNLSPKEKTEKKIYEQMKELLLESKANQVAFINIFFDVECWASKRVGRGKGSYESTRNNPNSLTTFWNFTYNYVDKKIRELFCFAYIDLINNEPFVKFQNIKKTLRKGFYNKYYKEYKFKWEGSKDFYNDILSNSNRFRKNLKKILFNENFMELEETENAGN